MSLIYHFFFNVLNEFVVWFNKCTNEVESASSIINETSLFLFMIFQPELKPKAKIYIQYTNAPLKI